MDKSTFIDEEFRGLSIRAAFQRARIYADVTDVEREYVRSCVYNVLEEFAKRYATIQSDDIHEKHIEEFAERLTAECAARLHRNRFRIGVAQKALNLYLKYLWCNEKIPTPPHCPFDAVVIDGLGMNVLWTEMDSIDQYRTLVSAAKKKADGMSLAEWELQAYSA